MRKIVFPQESNLQPLDYRSTALPLELEKTPPRMLNFGYLNPATCLLYDCNNIIIIIFIYLPSDVISQEITATSSTSITKASKYAIPLKPTHKLAEPKRYLVTW